jgi:hypothetical protein
VPIPVAAWSKASWNARILGPWVLIPFEAWIYLLFCPKTRDSSVGMALGYGLDDRGCRLRFPAAAVNFSLNHRAPNGSGAHPASYPMDTRALSLGVKRPGREAVHSPPSSTEIKD